MNHGLYDKTFEHDSCGVGFVVNINGRPNHQIVTDGIEILNNLVHRGAVGGDQKTGDGTGMLLQVPHEFFVKVTDEIGFEIGEKGCYGVGFLFMPGAKSKRARVEKEIGKVIRAEGGSVLGWRDVPVNEGCLGAMAKAAMPFMKQLFVACKGVQGTAFENKLYVIRRSIENRIAGLGFSQDEFYIPSFSSRIIVYKGMLAASQFEKFYPDLLDRDFASALALIHQRYSTNTFPSWALAQPFRYMAHNGEINTLKGNVNYMKAREGSLSTDVFGEDLEKVLPVIMPEGSDSAKFDNTLELLASAGRSVEHVMMMMIPEAFGRKYHISADKRAFYEFHSNLMEPWDGPAAIAFTDGTRIGAILDRNGLRPVRYVITKSGKVVLASEVGVLDISPEDVLEKGRLAPGKMILVDTAIKRVRKDNEVKAAISRRKPYRRWLEENRIELRGLLQPSGPPKPDQRSVITKQAAFGYTLEDINMILLPMAKNAQEPIGSMGDDEAPGVLQERPQLLFRYFKQLFAQVTNPPIDPYRENLVMSLMSFIGRERNLLEETPQHCHQLKLIHPILTNDDMHKLLNFRIEDFKTCIVPALFKARGGSEELESAIEKLCVNIEKKVDQNYSIVVISDRGTDKDYAPIPALLAVSAVNNYLIKQNKRHLVGLVVQSGEVKEVMDFATLISFGASAVNPYLVFETLSDLKEKGGILQGIKLETAMDNYITAVKKGLLKIMSKMGISTIRSYKGARNLEAIGLNSELINRYFPGTPSRIEGIGIDVIANETLRRHSRAFSGNEDGRYLEPGGHYKYKHLAENHLLSPEAIILLQKAVRAGNYADYKKYARIINDQSERLCTLRGLFKLKKSKRVPLSEVESVDSIIKRFVSSAMSLGSISKEAHETMAIAMNRLGAQSNSGEGGEDESRYAPLPSGDSKMSKVKQVASGRFGVNSNYLANAKELQIKIAQGAKPGEGGQLPGHKVDEFIARVRHSTPGVMLISPPPHHDIYSIEDLSELIYDLKNANPEARVSVKLVSEVGVGTVAAGVAKGRADMVLISGGDGGTGASPLSSIKHAGIPWEIGLAETQQTLVMNNLRNKIRVQVDGQLRTGRDVVIGALLGAEEFGFGTISLVTLGCVMARKCHQNTCPVGVATQDPELRKRFQGKPEHLENFMTYVATEAREIMAEMGFRTFDEMIGRSDRLGVNESIMHWKAEGLDFSRIFKGEAGSNKKSALRRCSGRQETDKTRTIDDELISNSEKAIKSGKKVSLFAQIRNRNRAVGAKLSYIISRKYGSQGLPDNTLECKFTGTAGQSFGAFLAPGVTFELEGDANDYIGKGLSGGRIILYPQRGVTYRPQNNVIAGNVNLFGATAGEVFIHGQAGERFAVRNSGANAVVEGIGDHGCEYMTGGRVIVLGSTGINFAAGMSGGLAYVLDENQLFDTKCNLEMVDLEPVVEAEDVDFIYSMIKRHVEYTGSRYAGRILEDWDEMQPKFVKVFPLEYKKAIERIKSTSSRESEVLTITEEVY